MYVGLGADITQTWPNLTVSGYPTTSQLQAANAAAAASLPTASLPASYSSGAALYNDGSAVSSPACNTLMVPTGTYGPFNCSGDQSQVMTYDASGDVTAAGGTTATNWLATGNNAVYAGLAVAALFVVMAMGSR
jgi:hypothetical protein